MKQNFYLKFFMAMSFIGAGASAVLKIGDLFFDTLTLILSFVLAICGVVLTEYLITYSEREALDAIYKAKERDSK